MEARVGMMVKGDREPSTLTESESEPHAICSTKRPPKMSSRGTPCSPLTS
ncbi:hypothetical protein SESBI_49791 [Sesbania bispinosa]|nr:hypothetical protein SESBI_49791 [Sesbania bispinosa]